jgi:hypothetical protein
MILLPIIREPKFPIFYHKPNWQPGPGIENFVEGVILSDRVVLF